MRIRIIVAAMAIATVSCKTPLETDSTTSAIIIEGSDSSPLEFNEDERQLSCLLVSDTYDKYLMIGEQTLESLLEDLGAPSYARRQRAYEVLTASMTTHNDHGQIRAALEETKRQSRDLEVKTRVRQILEDCNSFIASTYTSCDALPLCDRNAPVNECIDGYRLPLAWQTQTGFYHGNLKPVLEHFELAHATGATCSEAMTKVRQQFVKFSQDLPATTETWLGLEIFRSKLEASHHKINLVHKGYLPLRTVRPKNTCCIERNDDNGAFQIRTDQYLFAKHVDYKPLAEVESIYREACERKGGEFRSSATSGFALAPAHLEASPILPMLNVGTKFLVCGKPGIQVYH